MITFFCWTVIPPFCCTFAILNTLRKANETLCHANTDSQPVILLNFPFLTRFVTRPDVKKEKLAEYLDWSLMTMDKANSLCKHLLIDYFMDNLNVYSIKRCRDPSLVNRCL